MSGPIPRPDQIDLTSCILAVIGDAPTPRGSKSRYVRVRCGCGVEKAVKRTSLYGPGAAKSCGCLRVQGHRGSRKTPVAIYNVVRPAIAEIYVSPTRLLGRAIIALSDGPLTATDLAKACRLGLDDLEARAMELSPAICALNRGASLLLLLVGKAANALNKPGPLERN